MVCLLEINGTDSRDSIEWSSYSRVLISSSYKLKPSDPVRILGEKDENNIRDYVNNHRERIRQTI